jgi:translation initiation factor 1 (eIF-1/SUI1)
MEQLNVQAEEKISQASKEIMMLSNRIAEEDETKGKLLSIITGLEEQLLMLEEDTKTFKEQFALIE